MIGRLTNLRWVMWFNYLPCGKPTILRSGLDESSRRCHLPGSVSLIPIPVDRHNDPLVVWKALYTLLTTTIRTDIGYYKANSIRASIMWIA